MQSVKLFFQGFFPAFLIFSLMIMAAVLWVTPLSQNQEKPTQSYIDIPQESNGLTLLSIHADEQLHSITLLVFNARQGTITIHSFPTDSIIDGEMLSNLWEHGKFEQLKPLISAYSGYEIQRQLVVNSRQLLSILEYVSPISAVLEEPLSYTQSVLSVTLEAGIHQLSAEQCMLYLKSAESPQLRARRCEELLRNTINSACSLTPSQLQEAFLLLLDASETDLSIHDFDRCAAAFFFMAQIVEQPAIIQ